MSRNKQRPGDRHRSARPPRGVLQYRASAWCGCADHPRVVVVGFNIDDLQKQIDLYRCEACGERDGFRWFATSSRAPEPGAPAPDPAAAK
jgi:hypothetical protein